MPAPYWAATEIEAVECRPSYAAPDGTVTLAAGVLLMCWLNCTTGDDPKCGGIVSFVFGLLATLIVFAAAVDNLYDGDTSMDEIFFAVLLGIWLAFTWDKLVKVKLYPHIADLHLGAALNPGRPLLKLSLVALIVQVVSLGLCIGFYFLMVPEIENKEEWAVNIKAKCPDYFEGTDYTLERFYAGAIFAVFGKSFGLLGAYLGILLQYRKFQGTSLVGPPAHKRCCKTFTRNVLLLAITIPYQVCLAEVPRADNLWLWMIVQNGVQYFLLFFTLFGLSDYVLLRMGLYDRKNPHSTGQP